MTEDVVGLKTRSNVSFATRHAAEKPLVASPGMRPTSCAVFHVVLFFYSSSSLFVSFLFFFTSTDFLSMLWRAIQAQAAVYLETWLFWVVSPCGLVRRRRVFGQTCCVHLHLQIVMASWTGVTTSASSPPWEPRISLAVCLLYRLFRWMRCTSRKL